MIRSKTSQLNCPSAPRGHSTQISRQDLEADSHTGEEHGMGVAGRRAKFPGTQCLVEKLIYGFIRCNY
jgi:hypothetical protein